MRFLLACLFIGLNIATAQPIGTLNRPFNQPIGAANNPFAANNINPFVANNPLAGLQQPFNNPAVAAAAAAPPSVGFPLNQPVLSGLNQPLFNQPLVGLNAFNHPAAAAAAAGPSAAGFPLNQPVLSGLNQPLSGLHINQPMMGLNALNNPLAQPQFFVQQALPQQALSQQNLLQQPIGGAAPQMGGLNLVGLSDQQIQQLAMQAAQPTLSQWLANDHQAIFQRAGALNQLPSMNQQPITAPAGGPLQGVQAIQAMPNTLAALQQQMQQPLTQNLLQLNPNLAQWMQQQQLLMQQAVRGPTPAAAAASAPPAQQFPIPGNSPVGQFQVDQGPLTGANPQAIMMPSMQSRPSPQSPNQPLNPSLNINQPILQGSSLPLQQPSGPSFNAPDLQDFTLTPSGPAPQQPASGPQPIMNQAGQTSMNINPAAPNPLAPQLSPIMNQVNPAGPQGMPNMNNPINAPRRP